MIRVSNQERDSSDAGLDSHQTESVPDLDGLHQAPGAAMTDVDRPSVDAHTDMGDLTIRIAPLTTSREAPWSTETREEGWPDLHAAH